MREVHPFMRGILTGHLPDLFPLTPPDRDPTCAYREELLERLADDIEVFASAVGLLVTDANRELCEYMHATYCIPEGADDELRRLLVERVNNWIEGKL